MQLHMDGPISTTLVDFLEYILLCSLGYFGELSYIFATTWLQVS